jgi:anti-sigma regulatory factor (Ser/Thr protein kinase)
MELRSTLSIPVTEPSQVGEARREALRLAQRLGLEEEDAGRVALVATELSGNLVKHAGGGELLVRALEPDSPAGVEMLALDRGGGMEDVARCLRDGFSTAGSAGEGLGAVGRISDLLQIHSAPGHGTAILSQVRARRAAGAVGLQAGVVSTPKPGQTVCGDGWAHATADRRSVLVVADGLGHGMEAAEAAVAAIRIFRDRAREAPAAILAAIHAGLRATRGAAVAVAEIVPAERVVRYAAVGNIAGIVMTPSGNRSMVSHNGIVGHQARRIQELTYPWEAGASLILTSDGILSRWDLGGLPGLLARHPALIAGVVYRDFGRGTDDTTVAVVRELAGA